MNILLLTSCNRIKQVLLSLSLNMQTIKGPFAIIIADGSTPLLDAKEGVALLNSDDCYNVVTTTNYSADINLLWEFRRYLPSHIIDYKVIHAYPRMQKQHGEANLMGIGMMQAALMGNRGQMNAKNLVLKLTGTSILTKDVVSQLPSLMNYYDVLTWHRANIGGEERSTRIMGFRPDRMVRVMADEGWYNFVDDNSAILEQRFAMIINRNYLRVNYTKEDENGYLLEGGMAMQQSYGRQRINDFIRDNEIDWNKTPYLLEFMDGGIW